MTIFVINRHDPLTCGWCQHEDTKISPNGSGSRDRSHTDTKQPNTTPNKPQTTTNPFAEEPDTKPEPKTPNPEREAVFRVLISVENQLAKLPNNSDQIAGLLEGRYYVGDKTASGNPLARYLRDNATWDKTVTTVLNEAMKVQILVEENGIIVETSRYQICINTPPAVRNFLTRLRAAQWPQLVGDQPNIWAF